MGMLNNGHQLHLRRTAGEYIQAGTGGLDEGLHAKNEGQRPEEHKLRFVTKQRP